MYRVYEVLFVMLLFEMQVDWITIDFFFFFRFYKIHNFVLSGFIIALIKKIEFFIRFSYVIRRVENSLHKNFNLIKYKFSSIDNATRNY